jgi:hypothetical protein
MLACCRSNTVRCSRKEPSAEQSRVGPNLAGKNYKRRFDRGHLSKEGKGERGQSLLLRLWRVGVTRPKGHPVKVKIAQQLRWQTPMSRQWIADRLRMGNASYVSSLLSSVDSKL